MLQRVGNMIKTEKKIKHNDNGKQGFHNADIPSQHVRFQGTINGSTIKIRNAANFISSIPRFLYESFFASAFKIKNTIYATNKNKIRPVY